MIQKKKIKKKWILKIFYISKYIRRTTYYIDRHCQDTPTYTSRHLPEYNGHHVDKAICTELFKETVRKVKRAFFSSWN